MDEERRLAIETQAVLDQVWADQATRLDDMRGLCELMKSGPPFKPTDDQWITLVIVLGIVIAEIEMRQHDIEARP